MHDLVSVHRLPILVDDDLSYAPKPVRRGLTTVDALTICTVSAHRLADDIALAGLTVTPLKAARVDVKLRRNSSSTVITYKRG